VRDQNRILIIDDEPHLRKVLSIMLESAGYGVAEASSGEEGLEIVSREEFQAVLCDVKMPGLDGMEVLASLQESRPDLPVIMITAFASVESAVEAMKAGAANYVSKPFNEDQILIVVEKALDQHRLVAENRRLKKELWSRYDFSAIITASPKMAKILEVVAKVAETKSTILIQGESGTGKELLAQAVHYNSPRKEKPFTAVNCGAIPETLIESELFGHVRGAFTGADRAKQGLIRASHQGTLFLDEVGDLSPDIQVKLLRVIQEEEVRPVGSTENRKVDLRLVAATNKDLESLTQEGGFREDLFYRLAVIRLTIPPLRERSEDIPLLANHIIREMAEKHGRPRLKIPETVLARLAALDWPGNVRQLQNIIEQALLLSDGPQIGEEYLPLPGGAGAKGLGVSVPEGVLDLKEALAQITKETEFKIIGQALAALDGNRTRTAEAIGISRRALLNKIKAYGL
jgi:two-component system, NtrC family, response regulator AtoC